jgi:hypothetical protein
MPVDLSALTFSSDIVPSLYALLGYEPGLPGSLAGRAAFGPSADDSAWRRRDEFLLASATAPCSVAPPQRNADVLWSTRRGSDSAFDLSDDGIGRRLPVTETVSIESRARIRQHLACSPRESLPSEVMTAVTHARRPLLPALFCWPCISHRRFGRLAGDFFRRDTFRSVSARPRAARAAQSEKGDSPDALPLAHELERR